MVFLFIDWMALSTSQDRLSVLWASGSCVYCQRCWKFSLDFLEFFLFLQNFLSLNFKSEIHEVRKLLQDTEVRHILDEFPTSVLHKKSWVVNVSLSWAEQIEFSQKEWKNNSICQVSLESLSWRFSTSGQSATHLLTLVPKSEWVFLNSTWIYP